MKADHLSDAILPAERNTSHMVPLSPFSIFPRSPGAAVSAFRNSLDLARHLNALGYRPHWMVKHHNLVRHPERGGPRWRWPMWRPERTQSGSAPAESSCRNTLLSIAEQFATHPQAVAVNRRITVPLKGPIAAGEIAAGLRSSGLPATLPGGQTQ
jgi:hypothetical protein